MCCYIQCSKEPPGLEEVSEMWDTATLWARKKLAGNSAAQLAFLLGLSDSVSFRSRRYLEVCVVTLWWYWEDDCKHQSW